MPATSRRLRQSPRTSARVPNLSSEPLVALRRDPAKTRKAFGYFREILAPLGVFQGLSVRKRIELLALAAELHAMTRDLRMDQWVRQQLKKAQAEAPRRGNKMRAKLKGVAEALDALADYVEQFEKEGLWGTTLLGLGVAEFPAAYQVPLHEELRQEAQRYLRMRTRTAVEVAAERAECKLGAPGFATTQVQKFATLRFTEFFTKDCGLPPTEADVRTATIGNTLLGWSVTFTAHSDGADRKRSSETIRSRRRRAAVASGQVQRKRG